MKASTMIERNASGHWKGSGKNGQGQISTETRALQHFPCGVASRAQDTQARVRLAPQGDGFVIDQITLALTASDPGVADINLQATLLHAAT
jgi:osmotically inducible protein OsmC